MDLFTSILSQTITFLPLAFAISISYCVLRATDMTLDGSFVLGAAVFAKFIMLNYSPLFALFLAILGGGVAGVVTSLIQYGGKVDSLLAGLLTTFILTSLNLLIMGRPNIDLLSQTTLVSQAFTRSESEGWMFTSFYILVGILLVIFLMTTRFGLRLRALGDNAPALQRLGYSIEYYRMGGFALTNALAALAGVFTAQTVGYADINMGLGMTLTGIGAIILGQQVYQLISKQRTSLISEVGSCLLGVLFYFLVINILLRLNIDTIYLKLILGITLIFFLRAAHLAKRG